MFGNVYGLDLGTYEIKVYDKKLNSVWKEKNTIAIKNRKEVFSVGDAAYDMYEKAPENIEVVFPMQEGVISRFYDMQYLLENLLKKNRQFARGARYVISVPTDVTEVEKKAFYDLVIHSTAKAREAWVVERGIADAIGLGLHVQRAKGIFIVNMGAETTEISVLASGGMVLSRILKIGGASLDRNIINHAKFYEEFLIGRQTAELLRKTYGIADKVMDAPLVVSGRNMLTGIPEQRELSANLVRGAMEGGLKTCAMEIRSLLERTPPEVLLAIQKEGIYLTGGLANLHGIAAYISEMVGLKVHVDEEPEMRTVYGLKKIIQMKDLKKFAYSMLDENYGWMR
ncbi:MAG: rod shape-determining protein [Faecalimonas sp.]|nr:rod shape-determining protein [Faecalimonas sp.]